MWLTWQLSTGIGIAFGAIIPSNWSLDFGVSLCFIAILIPLKKSPSIIAATIGGSSALLLNFLPYNPGLIIGATTGILAGYFSHTRLAGR